MERTAPAIFARWLGLLGAAVEARRAQDLAALFDREGHWRDLLAFTWEFRTFSTPAEIREGFEATFDGASARNFRLAPGRSAPVFVKRSGRSVVEGYFEFDTAFGTGVGFARLLDPGHGEEPPRIWQFLTTLHTLRGFEEKSGANRPTGEEFSKIRSPVNWQLQRDRERAFADRDPEVIIVGAGQGGLILAARLRQMGVDALVLEKTERVGDVWRQRYSNLTLHNEIFANHFPYMPFPETWPTWLPKDMMGNWLEAYAAFMELNVWTGIALTEAAFDEATQTWRVSLRRQDGRDTTLRCRHLVAAMGVSGGVPRTAKLPGLSDFDGTVLHSSAFRSGLEWAGKRALVVGSGNSGHDIAQDLHVSGAAEVSLMQRGPTCVISLEPGAAISYAIYAEGRPTEDADLMTAAIPYPVLIDTYQWITRKTSRLDEAMLDGLREAGFRTHLGEDETGFQLLYLRGAGGYYIDVGCADLIIQRKIPVLQADEMDRFEAGGLRMRDGRRIGLDLVVLATGFESMQEGIRRLLGDAVADRVGPVWGFDGDHNMRNVWRPTAQPNFWIMGGAITEARLFSRFLAVQIKASLEGLMPQGEALPLKRHRRRLAGERTEPARAA